MTTDHPETPTGAETNHPVWRDLPPGESTARRVLELARVAETQDGDPPFSDQTLVDLRSAPERVTVTALERTPQGDTPSEDVAPDSGETPLAAAAVVVAPVDREGQTLLEAVVAPDRRGAGLGRELVERALEPVIGPVEAWAHGDHAAARAVAATLGFEPVRELHRLLRPLRDIATELPVDLPAGLGLRPFNVGQDESAWLEVNAAAFADHPEQGRMTLTDLEQREGEGWFDPRGFLIAHPLDDPQRIAGFHWTKIHPATAKEPARGEVHVVGIAPDRQGLGLGRSLTIAGLHYLAEQGLDEVLLYVDGDNEPAMNLYRSIGFRPWHLDVMFSRT
ncbi:mycothiol synthase [Kocuria sp. JC486]|uniref:mycothiol synthase n=1 Tax=Kocuria sp. JC486 TaxID=1970736 RepID=UPI001421F362|nr:mycothiol synthase [Kocuria sp. JC486]